MRKEIQVSCGTVVAEYNYWTGKVKIFLNGKRVPKKTRRLYVIKNGEEDIEFYVGGNFFTGVRISSSLFSEYVFLTERMNALDYIFGFLPGVVTALFGAIGGIFGGLAVVASFAVVPHTKPLWLKIILGIEFTLVGWLTAFLAAYLVGLLL